MRKYILGFLILLLLVIGSIYLFIPSPLAVAKTAFINANGKTIHRNLTDTALLKKMGAAHGIHVNGNKLSFNEVGFQFKEQLTDNISIPIYYGDDVYESYFSIVNINPDSCAIEWRTQMSTGHNPFKKVQSYFRGKNIQDHMARLLSMVGDFATKGENIYDIKINREKVNDTLLISTKSKTPHYPTTDEYYSLINKLQGYAVLQGVNAVNYPMLHIDRIDTNQYETMVALPINKIVPDKGNIIFKKMVAGNILTTEVKGGDKTIERGFFKLGNYVTDYSLVSPAISFQSLVTNRQAERDTAKWVTKLYTPVF